VGSFTRDFERWFKEGSGNGVSLSLWERHEGNLEGGRGKGEISLFIRRTFIEEFETHVEEGCGIR